MSYYLDTLLQFVSKTEHATFGLVCKDWNKAYVKSGKQMSTSYSTACSSIEMLQTVRAPRSNIGFFDQIVKDGNIAIIQYAISEKFAMSSSAIEKIPLFGLISLNQSVNLDRTCMEIYLKNAMIKNDIKSVLWMIRDCNAPHSNVVEFFARNFMFEEMEELKIELNADLYNVLLNKLSRSDIAKLILEHKIKPTHDNISRAAGLNNVSFIETHISDIFDMQYIDLDAAVLNGSFEALQYLFTHGVRLSPRDVAKLIENGHLEILQWAVANGSNVNIESVIFAQMSGSLEIMKFVLDASAVNAEVEVSYYRGTVDMCDLLFERGHKWRKGDVSRCIISGNFEVLDWLLEKKADLVPRDAEMAAFYENRKFLEYYWETLQEFPKSILQYAIQSENYRVVNWIMSKGYVFDYKCVECAVKNDCLSILKWLQHKSPDRDIKQEAEEHLEISDSLRMLRWARDDMFSDADLDNAFANAAFEIIEFVFQQNFDMRIMRKIMQEINKESQYVGEPINEQWRSLQRICIDAYFKSE